MACYALLDGLDVTRVFSSLNCFFLRRQMRFLEEIDDDLDELMFVAPEPSIAVDVLFGGSILSVPFVADKNGRARPKNATDLPHPGNR